MFLKKVLNIKKKIYLRIKHRAELFYLDPIHIMV